VKAWRHDDETSVSPDVEPATQSAYAVWDRSVGILQIDMEAAAAGQNLPADRQHFVFRLKHSASFNSTMPRVFVQDHKTGENPGGKAKIRIRPRLPPLHQDRSVH
jgi:hypothetical protein